MRTLALITVVVLTACAPAPPPPAQEAKADPVTEEWYGQVTGELANINRRADLLYREGKLEEAGSLVSKGQELQKRLLAAPRPTLPAIEASSDLDDLYGRILKANHNVGWARLVYQKNVILWTNWKPQTPETVQRRKRASAGIAECDRLIGMGR